MTTKPKTYPREGWAVIDATDNRPVTTAGFFTTRSDVAEAWAELGYWVEPVRITVVRERKRKATKRRAKR